MNTKCMNNMCFARVVSATTGRTEAEGNLSSSSANVVNLGSDGCDGPPRKMQVTAKILFGSVNAISNMKQSEKLQKKRSQ